MDAIRNGNFTSSEIFRLMKPGKAKGSWSVDAQTYIDEQYQVTVIVFQEKKKLTELLRRSHICPRTQNPRRSSHAARGGQ